MVRHTCGLLRNGRLFLRAPWLLHGILIGAAGLALLILTLPAFRSFFIGENFQYLGLYETHKSNFWHALLSPTDRIFFRPAFFSLSLPWFFLIPPHPLYFHIRNFAFSLTNIALLSLVLVYLRIPRSAQAIALFFFATSKVHFTTIGYINIYDSIMMLFLLLCTTIFFLRFVESKASLDYIFGMVFCSLSIFSKDYGLVVVGMVVSLVFCYDMSTSKRLKDYRWWMLRLAPLPVLVGLYLALRYAIVGPLPSSNAIYAPQLSLKEAIAKVSLLISAVANVSFTNNGVTGASGLGRWLTVEFPQTNLRVALGDVILAAGWITLLIILVSVAIRKQAGRILLFPFTWVILYAGPTLLTRNLQIYYMYEPLAGIAVLLGLCLTYAGQRLRIAWIVALVLVAGNGLISNYTSLYSWQFAANAASQAYEAVRAEYHGQSLKSITFITASKPFWQWTLTADYQGPLLPYLLRQRDLRVHFMDYTELRQHQPQPDDANLYFDLDNGFIAYHPQKVRSALVLRALIPAQAPRSSGFNVQRDGQSALAVVAENATPGTVIVMNERPLVTAYGGPTYLTALVPPEYLAQAGTYAVYLSDGVRESNRIDFAIIAEEPQIPLLRRLDPAAARANQAFNVQPGGQSALTAEAENATPDTVIVFGTRELVTTYGGPTLLTAIVPRELYLRPGHYPVYLRNRFGESNRLEFVVEQ